MSRPRVTVLARDQGFAPLGWVYSFKARATLTRVIAQTLRFDALGGSVLYEEYKGDLAQAQQIAETELQRARGLADPVQLADALLARGVVHLLQGEQAALACFEKLARVVPADYDRRLRAASYAYLATFWQYNRFADGNGAGGPEIRARWDGMAYLNAENPQHKALFAGAKQTGSRFESTLVHGFLCNLQATRASVQAARNSSPGALTQQMLQIALGDVANFRQDAEAYGTAPSMLAFADLAAADLCWRAGDSQSGGHLLHQALQGYQQCGDSAGVAPCFMARGDWLAAPFSTPLAWNLALLESSTGGSALAWTLEAREFSQQGADLAQARVAYEEAERLYSAASAPRGLANVLLRRGYLAGLDSDYAAAADIARRACNAFEQCGDWLGYWLAQAHRVLAHIGAGAYPEETEAAKAAGTWGASKGSFSYALGLGLLIGRAGRHWLIRQGDYERSQACYQLAAALFKSLGATANLAGSIADQGLVYQALGERKTAMTLYEQALDVYAKVWTARPALTGTLRPHAFMLASNLFQLYQDEMNPDGMERCAGRVAAFNGHAGQATAPEEVIGLAGGGISQLVSPAMDQALDGLQTFALGNQARAVISQARVLVPLYRAVQARDAGVEPMAERLFGDASQAAHTSDPDGRDFLEAVVYAQQKAYGEAKAAFTRYLAKGGADAGFVGTLAAVLQATGGAQGQAEALRQLQRTYEQAFSFMVRIKAYDEAKLYLDALMRVAGTDWWQSSARPWLDLCDCGELYEGLEQWEAALGYYDKAIGELEARRGRLTRDELKTALAAGSGVQFLYFQASRTALKMSEQSSGPEKRREYAARAFNYIERGQARALLDLMASSATLARSSNAESEAMRRWRRCGAQLAVWRGLLAQERSKDDANQDRIVQFGCQIETTETELRDIEAELGRSAPGFLGTVSAQADILSADQVAVALPEGTSLLQYAFLGDDLLAWALTNKGISAAYRRTADAKSLGRQIREFNRICMDCQSTEPLGTELAGILLTPLTEAIQAHSRLIIVPYGAAHALPFHALPWNGAPLEATHAISYLPSASTLSFVQPSQPYNLPDRILAVGNPSAMAYQPPLGGEPQSLRPLVGAEVEATYVASLFSEGLALVGAEATEPKVRELLSNYPLLHFATHGVLSEEAPLLSAILLANGEALNVYELMGLQLSADLVVLSACRTALGAITGGDDVIGLTRGLLGAGARAVIVSLWPVDDASTSILMGEFYRQLRSGRTMAVALQTAQNTLRELRSTGIKTEVAKLKDAVGPRDALRAGALPTDDYSHPHYWAPFVLVG